MPKRTLFFAGLALALVPILVRHYLLWPFPGSQDLDSVAWAYRLGQWIPITAIIGLGLALVGLWNILRQAKRRWTYIWVAIVLLLASGLYAITLKTSASRLFKPNFEPRFAHGTSEDLPAETLVMGIRSGDEAKAYPVRLLAYHHQVTDELEGQPIWVTYCSMCRTGKIFRSEIDGQPANFDLVGALRYNSVYRDTATGSIWYQANGKAVAGPRSGEVLTELRVDQMTLGEWLELYPESEVLQPDPEFADGYQMFGFDTWDEKRSQDDAPPSWQWVVAVTGEPRPRAYTWSHLAGERWIHDQLGERPIGIHLLADGISFRVWDRRLGDRALDLRLDEDSDLLIDETSGSSFGFDGIASGGELDGQSLQPIPASVEYRHSFETFAEGEVVEPAASPDAPLVEAEESAAEPSSATP